MSVSVWFQVLVLLVNTVAIGGLLVLAAYAGWKAFRWLRKWQV